MKTNKQLCLAMWEYFEKHPEQRKEDYLLYLINKGREAEYDYCFACEEAQMRKSDCQDLAKIINPSICPWCPIKWTEAETEEDRQCMNEKSPYYTWVTSFPEYEEFTGKRPPLAKRKDAIYDIVNLIKTTWKE